MAIVRSMPEPLRFQDFDNGVLVGEGFITLEFEENTGNGQMTLLSCSIDNSRRTYPTQLVFKRPNGSEARIVAQPGEVVPRTEFNPVLRIDLPGWSYSTG